MEAAPFIITATLGIDGCVIEAKPNAVRLMARAIRPRVRPQPEPHQLARCARDLGGFQSPTAGIATCAIGRGEQSKPQQRPASSRRRWGSLRLPQPIQLRSFHEPTKAPAASRISTAPIPNTSDAKEPAYAAAPCARDTVRRSA